MHLKGAMKQHPTNIIGSRVREARFSKKPKKLTQEKLASLLQLEGLDLDQAQISRLENGDRPVSDVEVAVICKVLNVSASWLLGETEKPERVG
jgi:transcriptional regulator with XRE-family HTH domain